MRTTRHKATKCPACGHKLDASSRGDNAVPKRGDLSVCWGCAQPFVYNKDLTLRPLSTKEIATIAKVDPAAARGLELLVENVEKRLKEEDYGD